MSTSRLCLPLLLVAAATVLTGCSSSFSPQLSGPVPADTIRGVVHGGQQQIVSANIYAFSSNATGYGTTAAPLASLSLIASGGVAGYPTTAGTYGNYVTTDAEGYFEIASTTPCTPGSITYLYSVGGNPGSGANTAAGLMAALGVCPASGLLAGSVTSQIYMNEVSTVAAAYALAGFAVDATHIAAPSTSDALAATGIQNAVANAAQLYSVAPTTEGSSQQANATTPGNNGTVPQKEIDSIANSLAACVNSSGPTSNACTSNGTTKGLFYYATSNGVPAGTAGAGTIASDTATAAIYIAQNPATNVTGIFDLAGSSPPFGTDLATAPADFSVTIAYTGGGLATSATKVPHSLAIDAAGKVWHVSPGANVLSEFSALGVAASSTGYSGGTGTFDEPYSVAIDNESPYYVWVANYGSGKMGKFASEGLTSTNYGITAGGQTLSEPSDAEVDAYGHLWVIDNNNNYLFEASVSTGAGVAMNNTTNNDMNEPVSLSIEPAEGGVWVSNSAGSDYDVEYNNSGTTVTAGFAKVATGADAGEPNEGSAIDSNGILWVAQSDGKLCHVTASATADTTTATCAATAGASAIGVAVDGADIIWVADNEHNSLYAASYTASTETVTALAGTSGIAATAPNAIAIDGSGDIWYSSTTTADLYEVIGAATPTYTPVAAAVLNSKLGSEP